MNNNNYYFDVTYRKEGSDIYQSLIVRASKSELAKQYVKEKGGIISYVEAKANIDEDRKKGKPVVIIQADRLLNKSYIETLLKEERLWKENEADTFQYKNWVLTLSKENKEYLPFKYLIEGEKIGTNETWCRRYILGNAWIGGTVKVYNGASVYGENCFCGNEQISGYINIIELQISQKDEPDICD